MTMAKVENNSVVEIGLPVHLIGHDVRRLKSMGWKPVEGTPKPTTSVEPGYRWEYGADWSAEDNQVYGTWNVAQRPQPYPSWSWVEGEGWVAPVAKPEGDFVWDEESQSWVEAEII